MKKYEYNSFGNLMEELSTNFRGNTSAKQINYYFEKLKKYKLSAVKRGINYLINNRQYPDFPIVGNITKAIEESKHTMEKQGE